MKFDNHSKNFVQNVSTTSSIIYLATARSLQRKFRRNSISWPKFNRWRRRRWFQITQSSKNTTYDLSTTTRNHQKTLSNNRNLQLFLEPSEKRPKHLQMVTNYYNNNLPTLKISLRKRLDPNNRLRTRRNPLKNPKKLLQTKNQTLETNLNINSSPWHGWYRTRPIHPSKISMWHLESHSNASNGTTTDLRMIHGNLFLT